MAPDKICRASFCCYRIDANWTSGEVAIVKVGNRDFLTKFEPWLWLTQYLLLLLECYFQSMCTWNRHDNERQNVFWGGNCLTRKCDETCGGCYARNKLRFFYSSAPKIRRKEEERNCDCDSKAIVGGSLWNLNAKVFEATWWWMSTTETKKRSSSDFFFEVANQNRLDKSGNEKDSKYLID